MILSLIALVSFIAGYVCGAMRLLSGEKKGGIDVEFKVDLKEYQGKFTVRGPVELTSGKKVIGKAFLKRTEIRKV